MLLFSFGHACRFGNVSLLSWVESWNWVAHQWKRTGKSWTLRRRWSYASDRNCWMTKSSVGGAARRVGSQTCTSDRATRNESARRRYSARTWSVFCRWHSLQTIKRHIKQANQIESQSVHKYSANFSNAADCYAMWRSRSLAWRMITCYNHRVIRHFIITIC